MEVDAGSNGIVPPDNFWPELRRVTRERGVFLIADEVMSGFGRCGDWFAWQRYGAENRPDLMTMAKGLTGARRSARRGVLVRRRVRAIEREMFYGGLTYCGHPLSCAAGVAAIDAYRDEKLIERSRRLGAGDVLRIAEARGPPCRDRRRARRQGTFRRRRARLRPRDESADRPLAPYRARR
jgi:taurine--2-oxoglutarate transaminase